MTATFLTWAFGQADRRRQDAYTGTSGSGPCPLGPKKDKTKETNMSSNDDETTRKVQLNRMDATRVVMYVKDNFATYNNPDMPWNEVAEKVENILNIKMSPTAAKTCVYTASKLLGVPVNKRTYRKKRKLEVVKQSVLWGDEALLSELSNIEVRIRGILIRAQSLKTRQEALKASREARS